jgi:hypothetical protein
MNETLYQAMGSVDDLKKYYDQRFRLFSKFDQGIMLDKESWFSVSNIESLSKQYALIVLMTICAV